MKSIKEKIIQIDRICSGTLLKRMKICGKPGCRCSQDQKWRHGPYFEWTRMEKNQFLHSHLTHAEADRFKNAIRNYKFLQKLIKKWEKESVKIMRSSSKI